MIFWIVCALFTFIAVLAVLLPFMRVKNVVEINPAGTNDLEVYKDQLREIVDDEARGLISRDDANAARTEVSRRILKLSANLGAKQGTADYRLGKLTAIGIALIVPVATWAAYSMSGSPQMPDQPFAARLEQPAGNSSIEVLIAKTELHLTENPNDGQGWAVIAPVYLRTGQYDKAALAYRKTLELIGPSVKGEVGLGEALAGVNGGTIGPDAAAAFKRASDLAPNDPQPKIYLATELAQKGKYPEARTAFDAILAAAPKDAPWRGIVEQSIAQLDDAMKSPALAQQPGPSQSDVESAAGMSDADRTAMIEGMVAKLDAKLVDNPADKEGWLRLIRSYTTLNKPDAAKAALARARTGLGGNEAALSEVKAMAVEMGLETP